MKVQLVVDLLESAFKILKLLFMMVSLIQFLVQYVM